MTRDTTFDLHDGKYNRGLRLNQTEIVDLNHFCDKSARALLWG